MDTLPDIKNITAWQANSGWFYITLYQVTGDSSALMPRKIPSDITDFQIIENDESLQLGIRLIKTIENHEFSSLEDENSIVASLHYSTEYLAQLDTVKKMNLGQQKKGMPPGLRNWLYITGTGLTVSGLLQDSEDRMNSQTQSGLGVLITTFLLDLIW